MEIKINSYSSQSSLISSVLFFIIGGILYAYAEMVLNFTSIAIGTILSFIGVFSLITVYINYKKGEIKKTNLIIGITTSILAIIFIIFPNLVEILLGITIGGWILLIGILRFINALKTKIKTKLTIINIIISLLLVTLGIYTITNGGLLLEGAGILMMISSGIEIIGYIFNKIFDKDNNTTIQTNENIIKKEILLNIPETKKETENKKIEEEIQLLPKEETTKKTKRRGRKKKVVKDI